MANYGPLHRNIEDLKEKNSQIGRVEETVGLIWCVSKEFKYKFVFYLFPMLVLIAGFGF